MYRGTFYDIWQKQSVEQHRAAPYVVGLLNCTLWFLYGLPLVHTHSTLMLSLNCFGVVMMAIYLAIFLYFCHKERRCMLSYLLVIEGIILICLGACVLTLAHEPKDRARVLGIFAVITACCMYATPVRDIVSAVYMYHAFNVIAIDGNVFGLGHDI